MKPLADRRYIAFSGEKRVAQGAALEVARRTKAFLEKNPRAPVLIFDADSSTPAEIDFRGSTETVLSRIESHFDSSSEPGSVSTGPGRPKLGVVSREIGLLPRHWDWLALQPGGASATLRKLVEEAKRSGVQRDRVRASQEAAHRFMTAVAGDRPLFEEALRALYAKKRELFRTVVAAWPKDIRDHLLALAEIGFEN